MTEQAFHEKYIKGINIKIILSVLGIIISGVWFSAQAVDTLKQSIIDGNRENRQFTKDEINGLRNEMNAKFDTVKFDQLQLRYDTKMQIYNVHKGSMVTEKRLANGNRAFLPYKP